VEGRPIAIANVPKRSLFRRMELVVMNRFVTLLALAIGVSGPASAGVINPYAEVNTNVVAGEVTASGVIERGHGFRVYVPERGIYEITFDRRYFLSGCAAMVVSPMVGPYVPVVTQEDECGGKFTVMLFNLNNESQAVPFQFIAREDAPQHH
jgi:hypothetical protein